MPINNVVSVKKLCIIVLMFLLDLELVHLTWIWIADPVFLMHPDYAKLYGLHTCRSRPTTLTIMLFFSVFVQSAVEGVEAGGESELGEAVHSDPAFSLSQVIKSQCYLSFRYLWKGLFVSVETLLCILICICGIHIMLKWIQIQDLRNYLEVGSTTKFDTVPDPEKIIALCM